MKQNIIVEQLKKLKKYDEVQNEIANEIIKAIKSENQTYGEVKKDIDKLEKSTLYEYSNQTKYKSLFNRVKEIIEKEMNSELIIKEGE